jgi:hypothetical protein
LYGRSKAGSVVVVVTVVVVAAAVAAAAVAVRCINNHTKLFHFPTM